MRYLLGMLRKADEAYGLIGKGDSVLCGVSGGKDSLALLTLLAAYRRIKPFELTAAILLYDEAQETEPLHALCEKLNVPLRVRMTGFRETVLQKKKPCSLCARLRRAALVREAKEAGCSLLALGHHREDAIETLLMNAVAGARLDTMNPLARMEREGVTVIRPLILAEEKEIAAFSRRMALPVTENTCPAAGHTLRADMKELIAGLEKTCPGASANLLTAIRGRLWSPDTGPADL